MRYDVETVLEYGGEGVRFSGMLPGNYEEIDLERKHPAVILLAGGAYWRRTPREKEAVALKFLAQGISPWILEYSVAPHVFPQSLCEALTAVAWLRERGEEYHLDARNISVCGFSAGGHLAASTGCFWDRDFVQELLGRPGDRVRPDKLILGYPVVTSGEYAHQDSIRCLLGTRMRGMRNAGCWFLWRSRWERTSRPPSFGTQRKTPLSRRRTRCCWQAR